MTFVCIVFDHTQQIVLALLFLTSNMELPPGQLSQFKPMLHFHKTPKYEKTSRFPFLGG